MKLPTNDRGVESAPAEAAHRRIEVAHAMAASRDWQLIADFHNDDSSSKAIQRMKHRVRERQFDMPEWTESAYLVRI